MTHVASGTVTHLVVHGQRETVLLDGASRRSPMDDATAWFGEPNGETRLRLWLPAHRNTHLTQPGVYATDDSTPSSLLAHLRYPDARVAPDSNVPLRAHRGHPADGRQPRSWYRLDERRDAHQLHLFCVLSRA